jgi:hypothetical protein
VTHGCRSSSQAEIKAVIDEQRRYADALETLGKVLDEQSRRKAWLKRCTRHGIKTMINNGFVSRRTGTDDLIQRAGENQFRQGSEAGATRSGPLEAWVPNRLGAFDPRLWTGHRS